MNIPGTVLATHEIRDRRLSNPTSADGGSSAYGGEPCHQYPPAAISGIAQAQAGARNCLWVWLPCLDVQAIQPAGYLGFRIPLRAAILLPAFSFKENAVNISR
ncbi:hypothetical protein EG831_07240 [bacterium]|nr:hypothetical protein [bacterium]